MIKKMKDPLGKSLLAPSERGSIERLTSRSISATKTLEILTSPDLMADFFRARALEFLPRGAILKGCRPKILRKRLASRQVVSYQLFFSGREGHERTKPVTWIVKRFADGTSGQREYSTMRMLWEQGFNHKSSLTIPNPFCYLEDVRMLVQEEAQGTSLRRDLSKRGSVILTGMKAAARWLIKLHRLDADQEAVRVHPDDEDSIRDGMHRAGKMELRLLAKLEEIAALTLERLAASKNARLSLVHGDFQCENIFTDKEKVTVIDFGRSCKSDPARDLGSMIAQVTTFRFLDGASPGSVLAGLKGFWEEYRTRVPPQEREGLSARACTFAALKYLENICYMSVFPPVGRREILSFLLRDAEHFSKADRVETVLGLSVSV